MLTYNVEHSERQLTRSFKTVVVFKKKKGRMGSLFSIKGDQRDIIAKCNV